MYRLQQPIAATFTDCRRRRKKIKAATNSHQHHVDRIGSARFAPAVVAMLLACWMTAGAWADELQFSRDIRPILSNKCFACHGPDEENRQGGLRLDVKESAFGAADSGEKTITPGELKGSELYRRITAEDESERMPPAEANKPLTADEIDLLRRWIEQGAPWSEHWSFIPPRRAELPPVKNGAWPTNAIDRFILARLEEEALAPMPAADKATLIRRVTLDLTGLPPTPAEVDAFLADDSPMAYEKLVDRLLKSPRYGEHMARFWLDAARYGDTHGLHLDSYREMWPYRDWVVQAFNQNMRFDQFTIEQLAGDLLPEPTLDQLVATGFNRCHVTTNEGGSIKEEVFVRNVVDRVVSTGTVFMGMTFECTRCHDHKYDPFTMNDFYSLFAFFNSIDGSPLDGNKKDPAPVIRTPSDQQAKQLAQYDQQIAALDQKLKSPWPEIDELQLAWEAEVIAAASAENNRPAIALGDWHTIGPFTDNRRYLNSRKHGPEGKPVNLEDEFDVASGKVNWTRRPEWVDGKPHDELPGQTAANFLYRTIMVDKDRTAAVSLGSDDGIKVYLNNKQVLAKDVARAVAADQEKLELKLKKGENHLLLKIMNYGGAAGFYFALQEDQGGIPADVLSIVQTAADQRSAEQQNKLREFYRNQAADAEMLLKAREELAALRKARADVDRQVPTTLILRETKAPRQAYFLKRGEYDQRGDEVSRRTPSVLPTMNEDLPLDRLGFAKWLVDPAHPLTARVAVNRFWQQVFGVGIVKTAEDFGSQGEPPSHPEMLDWLAVDFIESEWDVKALMKRLVMSSTYRQSSHITAEIYQRDPNNRLLARGPRLRLDAEMLRDQALYVSGILVETMGGPSVKPPQPDGLWFAVGYSGSNTVKFTADEGPNKTHRRTLYTFIKRTAPPPQMSTFDAPSREACTVRRERTNTPLQALLLMNDPQFIEAAVALAQRAMKQAGGQPADRAAFILRQCVGRPVEAVEVELLVEDFNEHLQDYRNDVEAAKKLAAVGEVEIDKKLDVAELAAWTMVANLVFNLDEVISKN